MQPPAPPLNIHKISLMNHCHHDVGACLSAFKIPQDNGLDIQQWLGSRTQAHWQAEHNKIRVEQRDLTSLGDEARCKRVCRFNFASNIVKLYTVGSGLRLYPAHMPLNMPAISQTLALPNADHRTKNSQNKNWQSVARINDHALLTRYTPTALTTHGRKTSINSSARPRLQQLAAKHRAPPAN